MEDPKSPRTAKTPSGAKTPGTADAQVTTVISDPDAAAVLTNPHTLRQLTPFLARERSVSEAAHELKQKPNTVLSRVRRFVALGLLEVARTVPRKGRAVKLYRTVADVYFVPFDVTSAETLEAAMKARDSYWEDLLRTNVVRARSEGVGSWGTRIYRDARGRLQVQAAVTPEHNYTLLGSDHPAALSSWRDSVYLDFDDAKTLQREMFFLLKRYQQKHGTQRYILRLGLALVQE